MPFCIENFFRSGIMIYGHTVMKSTNFEFIRQAHPELSDLGGSAERYIGSDPSTALVKLRTFAEHLVLAVFREHGFERQTQHGLNDLLGHPDLKDTTPRVVLDKLHALRIHGNRAAHSSGTDVEAHHAARLLKEAHSLAQWYAVSFLGVTIDDCGGFQEPSQQPDETKGKLKREKKKALQELAAREAEMAHLLSKLEDTRRQATTVPTIRRAHCTVTYSHSRLCFKAQHIEPLEFDQCFCVITPHDTFAMTKVQFYDVFSNVVESVSYRDKGIYHYPRVPKNALQFRVGECIVP